MSLTNKRIVIIGGSSGIGFAVARLAVKDKAQVIIASRSKEKLLKAKDRLDVNVDTKTIDMCDEEALKRFFMEIGKFDHLQIPASVVETGPFLELPTETAKNSFSSKFWGPYMAVKQAVPFINEGGSIVLYSGALGQRPVPGTVISASISCAVEGLARALSVELAPIRVNCISPGLTQTELFDQWDKEKAKSFFDNRCEMLIIKRPAQPEEIAESAIHLMNSNYTNGTTLYIDGGYTLK
ncbi:MAG: SDR family oxidoreductase [Gammaproteobacteria bacterium]|nr:SDR family oxidoreductase [Gammaproteobacteria bacterium]